MKKTELELNSFNLDKFKGLRTIEGQEKAMEYAEECNKRWENYIKENTIQETTYIEIAPSESKEELVETNVTDLESDTSNVSEDEEKEQLVKILKDSGMKIANTKWSIEVLKSKVASLTQ